MQSKVVAAQLRQRVVGVLHAGDLDVRALEQLADALALPLVVFDHQDAPQDLRELRFELPERLDQLLALDRLERVADGAALERLLGVVGHREHVHGNVPGQRVAFELIEHAQPGVVGKVDVQEDGARPVGRGRRQAVVGRVRHHALKAPLVRQVAQDRGEARIVFHDQDAPGVRRQPVAVVVHRDGPEARGAGCRQPSRGAGRGAGGNGLRRAPDRGRTAAGAA